MELKSLDSIPTNSLFQIKWVHKINGRSGKGTKFFTHYDGTQIVQELNLEYPEIHHTLELAPGEAKLPALPE